MAPYTEGDSGEIECYTFLVIYRLKIPDNPTETLGARSRIASLKETLGKETSHLPAAEGLSYLLR